MRVDVSGYKFTFPYQCACCGSAPQTTLTASASRSTGKRVVHTSSKSWDFPYCAGCIEHVRTARQAGKTRDYSIGASVLGTIALFFSPLYFYSIIVAIVGIPIGFYVYKKQMVSARCMCGLACVAVQSAVTYYGWQGTCHMFDIASPSYALVFMVANQSKLVNVTPKVWQWLQANGFGISPSQPQSARRFMN